MRFLRSNLIIAIVSLFVLTGYGFDLFGDCCSHPEQAQVEHGNSGPKGQPSGSGDGCQCVCHQVIIPLSLDPMRVAFADVVSTDFVAHADEFPPDAVPLGIDYPPQLA